MDRVGVCVSARGHYVKGRERGARMCVFRLCERERENRVIVCVCGCVCERECERLSVCVYVCSLCERERNIRSVRVCVWIM